MKTIIRFIPILILAAFFNQIILAQDSSEKNEYKSKVYGKIYSDFNFGLTDHTTAFEVDRAYFGFERQISEYFSANIKLDIGSPDDLSEYSKLRRYAYFKNAAITYKKNNLTAWFGLFDMQQFKVQEKHWGYRYLYKSFMDAYKFGPSADIGIGAKYKINNILSSDLIISNGEGYSSPQRDDSYKTGLGLTLKATESLTLRAYYSVFASSNAQMTFSGFAGYTKEKFRIGAEYNHQLNYKFNRGHNRYGYSAYSTYIINSKWELFLRYDQVYSNIVDDSDIPWNLANDGSAIIGGLQFTPIEGIHISLDYQDWYDYAGNGDNEQILYLHVEANF